MRVERIQEFGVSNKLRGTKPTNKEVSVIVRVHRRAHTVHRTPLVDVGKIPLVTAINHRSGQFAP